MQQMILYFQEDCHLCDDAEILLHQAGYMDGYRKVDIETDLELLKTYGIHVPVLQRPGDDEQLFWPFDIADIKRFWDDKKPG
jgi:hypothetical protein